MAPPKDSARMAPWLEQAWMQQYLERRLDAEELAWFEDYMLDKTDLLDLVSLDLDMRDALHTSVGAAETGLPSVAQSPSPARVPAEDLSATQHASSTRSQRMRSWTPVALAASVLLAFGAGYLLHSPSGMDDPIIANPTRFVLDTSRGAEAGSSSENLASESDFVLVDALVPATATYVAIRGPGLPEQQLLVSRDGVATLLLRRRDIARIGPLTLRIKVGAKEFEKPVMLNLRPGDNP